MGNYKVYKTYSDSRQALWDVRVGSSHFYQVHVFLFDGTWIGSVNSIGVDDVSHEIPGTKCAGAFEEVERELFAHMDLIAADYSTPSI